MDRKADTVAVKGYHRLSVAKLGILTLAALSCGIAVQAESPHVLTAQVTYNADLVPDELFGYWQRIRQVHHTSTPGFFPHSETGYWTISRWNDKVYLMNPDTGAQSEISITGIQGKTVTFEYARELQNGNWCRERLTLTPGEDLLSGTQSKQCFHAEDRNAPGASPYFYADARVEGQRSTELPPLKWN